MNLVLLNKEAKVLHRNADELSVLHTSNTANKNAFSKKKLTLTINHFLLLCRPKIHKRLGTISYHL